MPGPPRLHRASIPRAALRNVYRVQPPNLQLSGHFGRSCQIRPRQRSKRRCLDTVGAVAAGRAFPTHVISPPVGDDARTPHDDNQLAWWLRLAWAASAIGFELEDLVRDPQPQAVVGGGYGEWDVGLVVDPRQWHVP